MIVGDVANTADPVPVDVVSASSKFALDGVARNVATPVPSPLSPVLIGNPVQLVSVPLLGVPSAPPLTTNAPAVPTLIASAIATFVPGVARNVAMPAPSPLMPVDTGNPVQFVRVPLDGVPSSPPL